MFSMVCVGRYFAIPSTEQCRERHRGPKIQNETAISLRVVDKCRERNLCPGGFLLILAMEMAGRGDTLRRLAVVANQGKMVLCRKTT